MATQDRVPTGAGSSSQWTPLSGLNWENVDDTIGSPDDDATYNSVSANYKTDLFSFSAFNFTSSAITKVTVTFRAYVTGGGGSWDMQAVLRVNGTSYVGANHNLTGLYATYSSDWLTNPSTSLAWTEADIKGTGPMPLQEFGYRTVEPGAVETRCTQCYITVTYTEAGGGNSILRQMMMHHN